MSCLPQRGSVDVCCAWTTLKVNSFPSGFSVQCCLLLGNLPSVATAPLQKPRSPHSRWKRFLFCFSLAGKVTGRLASGIVAEQLGNCNGTWSNPSIFLVLSSRRAENLESWLRSIWQNEKSLPELVWQGLAERVYSWNNCVFAKSKKLKYTCLCATIWPFLGESSWLDKMQNVTAHLNCWNGWKREIQSWYRNSSWHRRPIFRHISEFGFSTRVNFSTGANFSVSMQICWKVTASILPVYCSMLSWRCVFAHDKTSLLQKWAHCGILSGHGLICLYVIYVTCLRNTVQTCSFLHPWMQQAWGFRAAFC